MGICSLCRGFVAAEAAGEDALRNLLHSAMGREADCIVGISGGRDSCYAAYLAVRRFGVRAVAVSYQHPFVTELARKNTAAVCASLGIELEWVQSGDGLERDLVRGHLESMAPAGTTMGMCRFCHYAVPAALFGAATRRGAPFVLVGATRFESWATPGRLARLARRIAALPLHQMLRVVLGQARSLALVLQLVRRWPLPSRNPLLPWVRPRFPADGPRLVRAFDYVTWDEREIEKVLEGELGWQRPATALAWRYDCALEPLVDYSSLKLSDISANGIFLSNLVRAGLWDREAALEKLRVCEDPARLEKQLREVLIFLGLPPDTFERFHQAR